jgi:hypothetical protein
MKIKNQGKGNQSGAIMIVAMLFATALLSLAYSSHSATDSKLAVVRYNADALQAELAAQSGIEYGRHRLAMDSDWTGNEYLAIEYSEGVYFTVEAEREHEEHGESEGEGNESGEVELEVEGDAGDGHSELEAKLSPIGGENFADLVLVLLGGEDYFTGVEIEGDILVTDEMDKVMDYGYDQNLVGGWSLGGPSEINGTEFHCSSVDGTIYKFTDTDYADWPASEVITDQPHMMPSWDLDVYLNSPEYRVFDGVTKVQYQNFWEPCVFILEPGQNLYLKNCNFWGGIVVWSPKDHDLRSGFRNRLKIKNSVIGSTCTPENIGIIAPACEVMNIGGASSTHGFSFVNEVKNFRCMHVVGQLVVVDRVKQARWSDFIYDSQVADNPPPGVVLNRSMAGLTISRMGEHLE